MKDNLKKLTQTRCRGVRIDEANGKTGFRPRPAAAKKRLPWRRRAASISPFSICTSLGSPVDLLDKLKLSQPEMEAIMLTAHGSRRQPSRR
jgi:hypothetical protein